MLGWDAPTGLGSILPAKEATALAKHLGLDTVAELLAYYPRAYSKNGSAVDLGEVEVGETVTCIGSVINITESRTNKGQRLTRLTISAQGQLLEAVFFSAPWIPRALPEGTTAMFSGKLSFFKNRAQLTHPKYLPITKPGPGASREDDQLSDADRELVESLISREWIAVYPATKSLTSWRILNDVDRVLDKLPVIPEPLPQVPEGMVDLDTAIREVHRPGPSGFAPARRRLKYNEALSLACVTALRRADLASRHALPEPRHDTGLQHDLFGALTFSLTDGQKKVLREISSDMEQVVPMSRLLQGEVGSGKTVVALAAMLQAVDNGHQAALMAPTEVLAAQHASNLTDLLTAAGSTATLVLVTGSMSTAKRREALLSIISGDADIIVGTHAVFQEAVEFFRLGLVVVDEQHRFGVQQRDRLRMKGEEHTPHLLVMTATPIPRTIAMTTFGDLAVSTLKELPGGRRPIESFVVHEQRTAWVNRMWQVVAEQAKLGHATFIVCPRIEEEGGVLDVAHQVQARFPELSVGILHGRMSSVDKEEAMAALLSGEIDILVATTVIEVGVDVPRASVMIIREAERFGISQLHQLRGRVGRGEAESLCFLHTETTNEQTLARLEEIAGTTDGFRLAELDLEHRSEGDVLGAAQSGRNSHIALLDLAEDAQIIARANKDAEALVRTHREIATSIAAEITPDRQEFLDKS